MQVSALRVLHDDIEIVVVVEGGVITDNVWVLHSLEDLDLLLGLGNAFGVQVLHIDLLHHVDLLVDMALHLVDNSMRSTADLLQHGEI